MNFFIIVLIIKEYMVLIENNSEKKDMRCGILDIFKGEVWVVILGGVNVCGS